MLRAKPSEPKVALAAHASICPVGSTRTGAIAALFRSTGEKPRPSYPPRGARSEDGTPVWSRTT